MQSLSLKALINTKQADRERPISILNDYDTDIRAVEAWKCTPRLVKDCRIWLGKLTQLIPVIPMW